jgi:hypothetical protein
MILGISDDHLEVSGLIDASIVSSLWELGLGLFPQCVCRVSCRKLRRERKTRL